MKRVVMVGMHYWGSERRGGFHWLADAWARAGWDVIFVTAGISAISRLAGNFRMRYPVLEEANRLVPKADNLRSYVLYTRWHPVALGPRWLDRLLTPFWRRYRRAPLGPLAGELADADLLVFESMAGLLLVDAMREAAPHARVVYRVSDDLEVMGAPSVLIEEERRLAPAFDRVSVPSAALAERFAGVAEAHVDHHGVRTELFDAATESPYPADDAVDAVFVGVSRLDRPALEAAARLQPGWRFHIIGPLPELPALPNVHGLGELPFEQTVPYLRHADVGLMMLEYEPGAEVFTDSLKVRQYTWCRLPIVAPDFLAADKPHYFVYGRSDLAGLGAALEAAAACDRSAIDRSGVSDWTQLAATLAGQAPA